MAIKLGDLLANPKGGKFFPVCAEDGGPAAYNGAQDTEGRFASCLKTSTRGNSFIKLKVCLDQVRLWDAQGQPLSEMGDLTNRECKVRAELKQVWMMSGQCGLLVEVTDLMLKEEEPQRCPF